MAYINDLFKIIITEMPYPWIKDWAGEYNAFASDVETFKSNITKDLSIDITNSTLYVDLKTFEDYPSFIKKLLYDRSNGISSRGQSVLSAVNLEKAKTDAELKDLIKKVILSPDSTNFVEFEKWWLKLVGGNNPVLINRAFAACSPKTLTSTVDKGKFGHVINFLKTECNFQYPRQGSNWFELNEMVTEWLDNELKEELKEFERELEKNNWRNIFFWMLYEYDPASFEFKKQLVKYGAPGTGKTYTCIQDVKNHFLLWKSLNHKTYKGTIDTHLTSVQFHPSFTYEDFLEGIRPVVLTGKTELKLVNGIFKTFCKQAAEWEIDLYRQIPALKEKEFAQLMVADVISALKGDTWEFLKEVKEPKLTLLQKVIPPYYFIIDEINRAELSRVLGELMFCLEYRGYRGKIKTQYASLVENEKSETAYWYENNTNFFFIPNNVYLLGTMNNIDRSVESFDFALRRRFQWIEVEPDYDLLMNDNLPEHLEPIVESLKKLNDKISIDPLLGKDYRIGHSYFMKRPPFLDKLNLVDCKNHLWEQNIKPLLEEYLRGSGENSRMKDFEKIFIESK